MSITILHKAENRSSLEHVFTQMNVEYNLVNDRESLTMIAKKPEHSCCIISGYDVKNALAIYADVVRELKDVPCIVILPSRTLVDRVNMLAAGVQNCYLQPVSYARLVMEVAQIEYLHEDLPSTRAHGPFILDYLRKSLKVNGHPIFCTRVQFEIMAQLMREPGRVYSRLEIWEAVSPHSEYPLANAIDVHVSRLRKQLPSNARKWLRTRRGFGYYLQPTNFTK